MGRASSVFNTVDFSKTFKPTSTSFIGPTQPEQQELAPEVVAEQKRLAEKYGIQTFDKSGNVTFDGTKSKSKPRTTAKKPAPVFNQPQNLDQFANAGQNIQIPVTQKQVQSIIPQAEATSELVSDFRQKQLDFVGPQEFSQPRTIDEFAQQPTPTGNQRLDRLQQQSRLAEDNVRSLERQLSDIDDAMFNEANRLRGRLGNSNVNIENEAELLNLSNRYKALYAERGEVELQIKSAQGAQQRVDDLLADAESEEVTKPEESKTVSGIIDYNPMEFEGQLSPVYTPPTSPEENAVANGQSGTIIDPNFSLLDISQGGEFNQGIPTFEALQGGGNVDEISEINAGAQRMEADSQGGEQQIVQDPTDAALDGLGRTASGLANFFGQPAVPTAYAEEQSDEQQYDEDGAPITLDQFAARQQQQEPEYNEESPVTFGDGYQEGQSQPDDDGVAGLSGIRGLALTDEVKQSIFEQQQRQQIDDDQGGPIEQEQPQTPDPTSFFSLQGQQILRGYDNFKQGANVFTVKKDGITEDYGQDYVGPYGEKTSDLIKPEGSKNILLFNPNAAPPPAPLDAGFGAFNEKEGPGKIPQANFAQYEGETPFRPDVPTESLYLGAQQKLADQGYLQDKDGKEGFLSPSTLTPIQIGGVSRTGQTQFDSDGNEIPQRFDGKEGEIISNIYARQLNDRLENAKQLEYVKRLRAGEVSISDALLNPRTKQSYFKGGVKVSDEVQQKQKDFIETYFSERGISLDEQIGSVALGPIRFTKSEIDAARNLDPNKTGLSKDIKNTFDRFPGTLGTTVGLSDDPATFRKSLDGAAVLADTKAKPAEIQEAQFRQTLANIIENKGDRIFSLDAEQQKQIKSYATDIRDTNNDGKLDKNDISQFMITYSSNDGELGNVLVSGNNLEIELNNVLKAGNNIETTSPFSSTEGLGVVTKEDVDTQAEILARIQEQKDEIEKVEKESVSEALNQTGFIPGMSADEIYASMKGQTTPKIALPATAAGAVLGAPVIAATLAPLFASSSTLATLPQQEQSIGIKSDKSIGQQASDYLYEVFQPGLANPQPVVPGQPIKPVPAPIPEDDLNLFTPGWFKPTVIGGEELPLPSWSLEDIGNTVSKVVKNPVGVASASIDQLVKGFVAPAGNIVESGRAEIYEEGSINPLAENSRLSKAKFTAEPVGDFIEAYVSGYAGNENAAGELEGGIIPRDYSKYKVDIPYDQWIKGEDFGKGNAAPFDFLPYFSPEQIQNMAVSGAEIIGGVQDQIKADQIIPYENKNTGEQQFEVSSRFQRAVSPGIEKFKGDVMAAPLYYGAGATFEGITLGLTNLAKIGQLKVLEGSGKTGKLLASLGLLAGESSGISIDLKGLAKFKYPVKPTDEISGILEGLERGGPEAVIESGQKLTDSQRELLEMQTKFANPEQRKGINALLRASEADFNTSKLVTQKVDVSESLLDAYRDVDDAYDKLGLETGAAIKSVQRDEYGQILQVRQGQEASKVGALQTKIDDMLKYNKSLPKAEQLPEIDRTKLEQTRKTLDQFSERDSTFFYRDPTWSIPAYYSPGAKSQYETNELFGLLEDRTISRSLYPNYSSGKLPNREEAIAARDALLGIDSPSIGGYIAPFAKTGDNLNVLGTPGSRTIPDATPATPIPQSSLERIRGSIPFLSGGIDDSGKITAQQLESSYDILNRGKLAPFRQPTREGITTTFSKEDQPIFQDPFRLPVPNQVIPGEIVQSFPGSPSSIDSNLFFGGGRGALPSSDFNTIDSVVKSIDELALDASEKNTNPGVIIELMAVKSALKTASASEDPAKITVAITNARDAMLRIRENTPITKGDTRKLVTRTLFQLDEALDPKTSRVQEALYQEVEQKTSVFHHPSIVAYDEDVKIRQEGFFKKKLKTKERIKYEISELSVENLMKLDEITDAASKAKPKIGEFGIETPELPFDFLGKTKKSSLPDSTQLPNGIKAFLYTETTTPTKKRLIKLRGGEKEADRVKVKREIVFYIPPSADKDGLQRIVGMENIPDGVNLATTTPRYNPHSQHYEAVEVGPNTYWNNKIEELAPKVKYSDLAPDELNVIINKMMEEKKIPKHVENILVDTSDSFIFSTVSKLDKNNKIIEASDAKQLEALEDVLKVFKNDNGKWRTPTYTVKNTKQSHKTTDRLANVLVPSRGRENKKIKNKKIKGYKIETKKGQYNAGFDGIYTPAEAADKIDNIQSKIDTLKAKKIFAETIAERKLVKKSQFDVEQMVVDSPETIFKHTGMKSYDDIVDVALKARNSQTNFMLLNIGQGGVITTKDLITKYGKVNKAIGTENKSWTVSNNDIRKLLNVLENDKLARYVPSSKKPGEPGYTSPSQDIKNIKQQNHGLIEKTTKDILDDKGNVIDTEEAWKLTNRGKEQLDQSGIFDSFNTKKANVGPNLPRLTSQRLENIALGKSNLGSAPLRIVKNAYESVEQDTSKQLANRLSILETLGNNANTNPEFFRTLNNNIKFGAAGTGSKLDDSDYMLSALQGLVQKQQRSGLGDNAKNVLKKYDETKRKLKDINATIESSKGKTNKLTDLREEQTALVDELDDLAKDYDFARIRDTRTDVTRRGAALEKEQLRYANNQMIVSEKGKEVLELRRQMGELSAEQKEIEKLIYLNSINMAGEQTTSGMSPSAYQRKMSELFKEIKKEGYTKTSTITRDGPFGEYKKTWKVEAPEDRSTPYYVDDTTPGEKRIKAKKLADEINELETNYAKFNLVENAYESEQKIPRYTAITNEYDKKLQFINNELELLKKSGFDPNGQSPFKSTLPVTTKDGRTVKGGGKQVTLKYDAMIKYGTTPTNIEVYGKDVVRAKTKADEFVKESNEYTIKASEYPETATERRTRELREGADPQTLGTPDTESIAFLESIDAIKRATDTQEGQGMAWVTLNRLKNTLVDNKETYNIAKKAEKQKLKETKELINEMGALKAERNIETNKFDSFNYIQELKPYVKNQNQLDEAVTLRERLLKLTSQRNESDEATLKEKYADTIVDYTTIQDEFAPFVREVISITEKPKWAQSKIPSLIKEGNDGKGFKITTKHVNAVLNKDLTMQKKLDMSDSQIREANYVVSDLNKEWNTKVKFDRANAIIANMDIEKRVDSGTYTKADGTIRLVPPKKSLNNSFRKFIVSKTDDTGLANEIDKFLLKHSDEASTITDNWSTPSKLLINDKFAKFKNIADDMKERAVVVNTVRKRARETNEEIDDLVNSINSNPKLSSKVRDMITDTEPESNKFRNVLENKVDNILKQRDNKLDEVNDLTTEIQKTNWQNLNVHKRMTKLMKENKYITESGREVRLKYDMFIADPKGAESPLRKWLFEQGGEGPMPKGYTKYTSKPTANILDVDKNILEKEPIDQRRTVAGFENIDEYVTEQSGLAKSFDKVLSSNDNITSISQVFRGSDFGKTTGIKESERLNFIERGLSYGLSKLNPVKPAPDVPSQKTKVKSFIRRRLTNDDTRNIEFGTEELTPTSKFADDAGVPKITVEGANKIEVGLNKLYDQEGDVVVKNYLNKLRGKKVPGASTVTVETQLPNSFKSQVNKLGVSLEYVEEHAPDVYNNVSFTNKFTKDDKTALIDIVKRQKQIDEITNAMETVTVDGGKPITKKQVDQWLEYNHDVNTNFKGASLQIIENKINEVKQNKKLFEMNYGKPNPEFNKHKDNVLKVTSDTYDESVISLQKQVGTLQEKKELFKATVNNAYAGSGKKWLLRPVVDKSKKEAYEAWQSGSDNFIKFDKGDMDNLTKDAIDKVRNINKKVSSSPNTKKQKVFTYQNDKGNIVTSLLSKEELQKAVKNLQGKEGVKTIDDQHELTFLNQKLKEIKDSKKISENIADSKVVSRQSILDTERWYDSMIATKHNQSIKLLEEKKVKISKLKGTNNSIEIDNILNPPKPRKNKYGMVEKSKSKSKPMDKKQTLDYYNAEISRLEESKASIGKKAIISVDDYKNKPFYNELQNNFQTIAIKDAEIGFISTKYIRDNVGKISKSKASKPKLRETKAQVIEGIDSPKEMDQVVKEYIKWDKTNVPRVAKAQLDLQNSQSKLEKFVTTNTKGADTMTKLKELEQAKLITDGNNWDYLPKAITETLGETKKKQLAETIRTNIKSSIKDIKSKTSSVERIDPEDQTTLTHLRNKLSSNDDEILSDFGMFKNTLKNTVSDTEYTTVIGSVMKKIKDPTKQKLSDRLSTRTDQIKQLRTQVKALGYERATGSFDAVKSKDIAIAEEKVRALKELEHHVSTVKQLDIANLSESKTDQLINILDEIKDKKQKLHNTRVDAGNQWDSIKTQVIEITRDQFKQPGQLTREFDSARLNVPPGSLDVKSKASNDLLDTLSGKVSPQKRTPTHFSLENGLHDNYPKTKDPYQLQVDSKKDKQRVIQIAKKEQERIDELKKRSNVETFLPNFTGNLAGASEVARLEKLSQSKTNEQIKLLAKAREARKKRPSIGTAAALFGTQASVYGLSEYQFVPDAIAQKSQPPFSIPQGPFNVPKPQITPQTTIPTSIESIQPGDVSIPKPGYLRDASGFDTNISSIVGIKPDQGISTKLDTKQTPVLTSRLFSGLAPRLGVDIIPRQRLEIKQETIPKTRQDQVIRPIFLTPEVIPRKVVRTPVPGFVAPPFWLASGKKKRKKDKKKKGKKKTIVWAVPDVWFGRYDPEEYKVIGKNAKTPKKFQTGNWGFDSEFQ